jgi:uncharacterized protein (DUF2236 family)
MGLPHDETNFGIGTLAAERLIETDIFEIVTADSLEREIDRVRAAAAGEIAGVFGPQSVSWRVDREAANFLGAGRALLLQLAHPWVAAAIEQHSDTFAHPIGRFHRTFRLVYALVFGSLEQSLGAARQLHQRHASMNGELSRAAGPFSAGSPYNANGIAALRWVYATLIDTSLTCHALVLPPLAPMEREHFYQESRLFAGLFGIPRAALPEDWSEFSSYVQGMVASDTLTVTNAARSMARRLLAGGDGWLRTPGSYMALTAELLPPRLREAFGLAYAERERRAAARLRSWLCAIYPHLPARLRYVGPYHEAQERLAGCPSPPLLTRLSNHFWIGQPRLPC